MSVFYNRATPMHRHRPLPVSIRALLVIALLVCMRLSADSSTSANSIQQNAAAQGPAAFARAAATALAHGRIDDAQKMAAARGATDPEAAAVLARIAVLRGKYREAQATLEPVVAANPLGNAALELGLLYQSIGRGGDATPILTALYRQNGGSSDGDALVRAARAANALGRARDANALFRDAERTGADPAAVQTYWGLLFLEKYNRREALKSFQAALKADADWAPAHAGLARVAADDDPEAAMAEAQRAIAIDPTLPDPYVLIAQVHLDEDRAGEARAELDKVLASNPSNLQARSLIAAMAYVKDDRAAFDRAVSQILEINPAYGEVYRVAGDLAASHYRFDEAAALVQRALALDPTSSRASGDLGMHLMRTGDEPGARRALDRAFRADPFDVVTYNLLAVLDKLDGFVTVQDGEFIFRMDKEEAPVLREYAIPLAHDAMKTLSERYQFTPKGPILVEIFPVHDDFAVRNLGLPGMIGALGACFGRVVTADSPRARPPGTFNWQATLWHELTHVVTLQMSNQRVPRWLTEGISVYEEGRARPEWGRDMEVTFARAMDKGKVLKLRDLNAGFTRPDTISLAYYEASLLVDHIVRTYGEPALRTLVRSFADGIDTEAAVTRTLKVSMDDLQSGFDHSLDQRFGAMRRALHDAPSLTEGMPIEALKTAAAAHPDSYLAQLALGEALASAGDAAAYAPLERAAALVPAAIGPESPHVIMAALAERLGDKPRARREYEAVVAADHTNVEAARKLAAIAQETKESRVSALALDRVVALDPFDAAAHSALGRIALTAKDPPTAVREFRVALQASPADKAAAHTDLGEAYLAAGRADDAKKEALAALEIAPTFDRAQELLLNAIGAK